MRLGIGIIKGESIGIKEFKNAIDMASFGRLVLQNRIKEEGFKWNAEGCEAYLQNWLDDANQMRRDDGETELTSVSSIIDEVADNLTYSNIHLQKLIGHTWEPLNSDEKKEFFDGVYNKLNESVKV